MTTILVDPSDIDINKLISTPNVWRAGSIEQQPSVELYNWTIKQMKEGQYFVGDEVRGSGRVSTAIQTYDPETKRGITASGRIYQLLGESHYSSNGEYVWQYYKQVNGLTEIEREV